MLSTEKGTREPISSIDTNITSDTDVSDILTTFDEILGFLNDPKPNVRVVAADAIVSCSEQSNFVEECSKSFTFSQKVAKNLLANVGSVTPKLSKMCITSLINLCHVPEIHQALLDSNSIRFLMDNLRDQERGEAIEHPALNIMLLANLTRNESGQYKFLGRSYTVNNIEKYSTLSEMFLHFLLQRFLNAPIPSIDLDYQDQYLWVGHILVNISTVALGRQCLLQGKTNEEITHIINSLSQQLLSSHPGFSIERRSSILSLFRNLSADQAIHTLLTLSGSLFIPSLCCLIYPRLGTIERRLEAPPPLPENGGILTSTAIQASTNHPQIQEEVVNPCGVTVRPGLTVRLADAPNARTVNSFINERSEGVLKSMDERKKILNILTILGTTREGRHAMRECDVYEVVRLWHLLELDEEIIIGLENMVHLLVYSEDELEQQDRELLKQIEE